MFTPDCRELADPTSAIALSQRVSSRVPGHADGFILDDGEDDLRALGARAKAEAPRWHVQNLLAIVILQLAAVLIWVNLLSLGMALPFMLKTLFGIETVFSRSPAAYMNSSTLLVSAMCTYLLLDPLARAFYALRCHHGGSLKTGADLHAQLKQAGQNPAREALS